MSLILCTFYSFCFFKFGSFYQRPNELEAPDAGLHFGWTVLGAFTQFIGNSMRAIVTIIHTIICAIDLSIRIILCLRLRKFSPLSLAVYSVRFNKITFLFIFLYSNTTHFIIEQSCLFADIIIWIVMRLCLCLNSEIMNNQFVFELCVRSGMTFCILSACLQLLGTPVGLYVHLTVYTFSFYISMNKRPY